MDSLSYVTMPKSQRVNTIRKQEALIIESTEATLLRLIQMNQLFNKYSSQKITVLSMESNKKDVVGDYLYPIDPR